MKASLVAVLLTTLAPVATAAPQASDARGDGMGGTGVASSKFWSAPLHNPALLTRYKPGESLGLVTPAAGAESTDMDDFVDSIEDFEDQFDTIDQMFDEGDPPTQQELDELAADLVNLDGSIVRFSGYVGLAVAMPSDSLAIGVVLTGEFEGLGLLDVSDADAAAISNALGDGALPDLTSAAIVQAAGRSEVGIALAREFQVAGRSLSLGITPKAQTIEVFNYVKPANEFDDDDSGDEDDFTDDRYRRDESLFNFDVGLSGSPSESWTLGLVVSDVIAQDVDSVVTNNRSFTYSVEPVATAGAAWTHGPWTLAADVDLTERQPFDFLDSSQHLSIGAELAGSWAQVRAGFRADLAGGTEDVLTAGLGLSPWSAFHLDVAGLFGEDTYGAALQVSWSF